MSLSEVSACLTILQFFKDKRDLMKANWGELSGLMARCELLLPLLQQLIDNQSDPRYRVAVGPSPVAAAEPCIVSLLNLLQTIDAFHDDFTKRTFLKSMERFAFTKSFATKIAMYEQQRMAITGILMIGEAVDNDLRRQIDHDGFNMFSSNTSKIFVWRLAMRGKRINCFLNAYLQQLKEAK
jgi:hypothetical protein